MDDLIITCDEIIDAEVKWSNEDTKSLTADFNEKRNL